MVRTLLKVLSSLGGHVPIMDIVVTSINNSITWIFVRHCPYYPYLYMDSTCTRLPPDSDYVNIIIYIMISL